MTALVPKLKDALRAIFEYTDEKKPKTLADAEHMLALINVIAGETLHETQQPAPT